MKVPTNEGEEYIYTVMDTFSSGNITTGTYTGTGESQDISLGSPLSSINIKPRNASSGWQIVDPPLVTSIRKHSNEIEEYLKSKYPEDFV